VQHLLFKTYVLHDYNQKCAVLHFHKLSMCGSLPFELPFLSADDQTQEYYNIESEISATVADQLQASPGIRIGRNGVVIADSMKVGSTN